MALISDSLSPIAVTMGILLVATALASKDNAAVRLGLITFSLLLLWRYLWWRAAQTLPAADWSLDYVFGTAFFLVELLVAVDATAMWIILVRTSSRSRLADRGASWVAQTAPLVDVLICTYNEEREILERTINGAKALHYRNYRLWVLDDGRRPWLRDLCAEKDCIYLARPDSAHAKAGNINHALKHIGQLHDRPDFIAVLDADFVPFPQFLSRALALCVDNGIGLVQTPQHFFNPDPIQSNLAIGRVFPDEQRFFFDALMPAKDAWGQAFCCGTSCVIRFSALEKIGFFPTGSVTEDFLLSARLAQHGYRTVYLNERLSVGLAPEGLREYTGQRARWCLGAMQIVRGRDGPFNFSNQLPLAFRIGLLETLIFWSVTFLFRVMCQLAPPAFLLFGIHVFRGSSEATLAYVGPMLLAQFVVGVWISEGRILPVMADVQQLLIAPEILRAVVSGLVFPKERKFKVTAKGITNNKKTVHWHLIARFAVLIGANIYGLVALLASSETDWIANGSLGPLLWAWYNLIVLIICCMVCVEQPRQRQHERYEVREKALVRAAESERYFFTRDVSVGGMSLEGHTPIPLGADVEIIFAGERLAGIVCRRDDTSFALMFADDRSREKMTSFIYNESVCKGGAELKIGKLLTKLIRRAAA